MKVFLYVCHACKQVVYVSGPPEEINRLLEGENYPCVTPLCRGRLQLTVPTKVIQDYTVRDMPLQAFYRAVHGFGAEGAPASLKRLKELLLSQRVVDLLAEPVGQPERVIVREMILANGAHLHFETSAKGACVYYIEEPHDRDRTAEVASCGCHPHREEAGRASQAEPGGSQVAEGSASHDRAAELPNAERVSDVSEAGDVHPDSAPGAEDSGAGSGVRV